MSSEPALASAIEASAQWLRERYWDRFPQVVIILGSGLGAFADALEGCDPTAYSEIPGFPTSTVAGHKGRLLRAQIGQVPVWVLQGRFHLYEGYSAAEVTFPLRVLGQLGARLLLVTNAAGGLGADLAGGDLMLISDHLNLMSANPLEGPNLDHLGPRFPDMSTCYDEALRDCVRAAATCELKEGVYAAMRGPSYETPAEIRMLRTLGADAVGMSTVPEVIVARHMGMKVVGISAIANMAAGIVEGHVLSHEEVVATMAQTAGALAETISASVPVLARELGLDGA